MTIKEEANQLRLLADSVPSPQIANLGHSLDAIRYAVQQILPDPEILGLLESVESAIAAAAGQLVHLRTKIQQAAVNHEGLIDTPDDAGTRPRTGKAEPGNKPLTRPERAESEPVKNRPSIPPFVKKRMDEGREFNKENWPRYPANEVILDNKKVLDSYRPRREIVSRKHTQIADIQPGTWQSYLREHETKYKPGERVKDSSTMREKYPDLVGQDIRGAQYIEVPVQDKEVPEWAIRAAEKMGVKIRDVSGRVYELPSEGA